MSIPSGTKTPRRGVAGGGAAASISGGAAAVDEGALTSAPPGSSLTSKFSSSNAELAAPSGTGTMISPAHFGQRTTDPALRRAMLINCVQYAQRNRIGIGALPRLAPDAGPRAGGGRPRTT